MTSASGRRSARPSRPVSRRSRRRSARTRAWRRMSAVARLAPIVWYGRPTSAPVALLLVGRHRVRPSRHQPAVGDAVACSIRWCPLRSRRWACSSGWRGRSSNGRSAACSRPRVSSPRRPCSSSRPGSASSRSPRCHRIARPFWTLILASGICAATSLTLPAGNPLEPRTTTAPASCELGVLLPIVAGGLVLAWLHAGSSAGADRPGGASVRRHPGAGRRRMAAVDADLVRNGRTRICACRHCSSSAASPTPFPCPRCSADWSPVCSGGMRAGTRARRSVATCSSCSTLSWCSCCWWPGLVRISRSRHSDLGPGYVVLRVVGQLAGGLVARRVGRRERASRSRTPPPPAGGLRRGVRAERGQRRRRRRGAAARGRGGRHHRVRARRVPPAASERGRMRRLLALALAVGAMASVRELRIQATAGSAATALALGFALMGASVTGDALRRFHLPRVTGYLLFGVVVGPSLGNLITESMAAQLQVVTGIATTLIALIAGLTLSVERLGSRLAAIARMTAATLVVAMAGLSAVAWMAWPWLPIAPDAVGSQRLVMLGAAGRDGRLVLADDDGGGGRGFGRTRPAERHGAGDRRARRSRDAGAVLACRCSWRASCSTPARAAASRSWLGWRGRSAGPSPSVCSSGSCLRSTCATSAAKSRWSCWRCAPC